MDEMNLSKMKQIMLLFEFMVAGGAVIAVVRLFFYSSFFYVQKWKALKEWKAIVLYKTLWGRILLNFIVAFKKIPKFNLTAKRIVKL